MGKSEKHIAIASSLLGIGGPAVMALGPEIYPTLKPAFLLVGAAMFALAALMLLRSFLKRDPAPLVPAYKGDQYINSGTNNGHLGPVNNYGKQRFELSDAHIGDLIQQLPVGGNVTLFCVGNSADFLDGGRLSNALTAHGLKVETISTGVFAPPPAKPLSVQLDGQNATVIFAPDA